MVWKAHLIHLGKALVVSAMLAMILLVGLAYVLYKTDFSGIVEHVMLVLIYLLPCLVGGYLMGRMEGQRKFAWGAVLGVVFFALLLLCAVLTPGSVSELDGRERLRVLAICAVGGLAGGMLS